MTFPWGLTPEWLLRDIRVVVSLVKRCHLVIQRVAILAKENWDLQEVTEWEKKKQALPNRCFYHVGGLDTASLPLLRQFSKVDSEIDREANITSVCC